MLYFLIGSPGWFPWYLSVAFAFTYAKILYTSTSQVMVKMRLDQMYRDFGEGKQDRSVISTETVANLTKNEKQTWLAIRKELQDVGISVDAFEINKAFIKNWFVEALATDSFDDQFADVGEDDASWDACGIEKNQHFHEASEGPVPLRAAGTPIAACQFKMSELTVGAPGRLNNCVHKLPTACRMTSTPQCCSCADRRPHQSAYPTYVDGRGTVLTGTRWLNYCPSCKGMNP
jgi:hypothetical protein